MRGVRHDAPADRAGRHLPRARLPRPGPRDAGGDPPPTGGGNTYETEEFAVEGDPGAVGDLPGGLAALGRLSCGHCGRVGRMVTAADLRDPAGRYRQADCPVCGGPLDGFGLSDWL